MKVMRARYVPRAERRKGKDDCPVRVSSGEHNNVRVLTLDEARQLRAELTVAILAAESDEARAHQADATNKSNKATA
jgi:hypothetical protein